MRHEIICVKPLPGYCLCVRFGDGHIWKYDMRLLIENVWPFVNLKEPSRFAAVTIGTDGDCLVWDNDLKIYVQEFRDCDASDGSKDGREQPTDADISQWIIKLEATDDEKIDVTAPYILERYLPAFQELAK